MPQKPLKIYALDSEQYNHQELFLIVLIDYLSDLEKDSGYVTEEPNYKKACKYAIAYLKATGQYRKQFQLCLKMFDGKKSSDFTDSFKIATKKIFNDYQKELVKDLVQFCKKNINPKKPLDIDFQGVEVNSPEFSKILYGKFEHYGANILNNHRQPHKCRIGRINFSSTTTQDKVGGKLRKLGKYACLEEAIKFIDIRIGLFDKYKYKKLVEDLEELTQDMLINSSNDQLKKSKKTKPTKQLVNEAYRKYEVLNNPKYLIDKNAYTQALRNRIKATLKGDDKKN